MKQFNKSFVIILIYMVLLFLNIKLFSQTKYDYTGKEINTITTAVPFLTIAPDAKAGSMGDAGVASTPDANSQHWNPAKYAFIDKNMGFSISYSPWLRSLVPDISLAYLSGYKKISKAQVLAGSLLYFSLGDITFTDESGGFIRNYRPSEYAADLSYSRKFSDVLSGGIAMRYIHSNLTGGVFVGGAESHAGNAFAADISTYYQKDIHFEKTPARLAFGLNISNIGTKISYTETTERDFIPINLRLGSSLKIDIDNYNSLAIILDFNKLLVPTSPVYTDSGKLNSNDLVILAGKNPNVSVVTGIFQSFTDAPGGFREEMKEITISTGVEYWYDKQFALRGGFFYEDKTKGNRKFFTLGAGLKYNVFGLDFAYLVPLEQRNPLENTLRFSLLFDFDAFKEQNQVE